MRVFSLILAGLVTVGLAACEEEREFDQEPETELDAGPDFTSEDDVYTTEESTIEDTADVPPEAVVEQFFDALRTGDVEAATALVARQPLDIGEDELVQEIEQWADNSTDAADSFNVIDSYSMGDFAIVRAEFIDPDSFAEVEVRPVILFQEEGDWHVVWDLLGKREGQVAQGMLDRLGPFYEWYNEQQLRASAEGEDDLPGRAVEMPGTDDEPDMQQGTLEQGG